MIRTLIALALIWLAGIAVAQDEPQLSVEFETDTVTVGQPVVLRMKVLVPTWMLAPPEFPALDQPGLLIRLPERATSPISETVKGETWSGVQRSYRIYPLQAGSFSLPPANILVTYPKPGETDPTQVKLPLEPVTFTAQVPAGAEELDPLIIAESFTLEQTLDTPNDLHPGDAVTRVLTAQITGTTPIMIPSLTPEFTGDAARAYPEDPVVRDTEERGHLSGSRVEETTYLATGPGTMTLPPVKLDWFNTETNAVETINIGGAEIKVTGTAGPTGKEHWFNWQFGLAIAAIVLIVLAIVRSLTPHLRRAIQSARNRWLESEAYAHRNVLQAIRTRDLGTTYIALSHWRSFYTGASVDKIEVALADIGLSIFSQHTRTASAPSDWSELERAYKVLRKESCRRARARPQNLQPLNPT
ncbi:hypothetical protein ROA7450_02227 [Roseovarius albus]|uniref:Oxygen tolerance n=1 Tax=Roseovarius albus TaxID=1247867 RepID=A0A1X6ZAT8_9RHOB|nr:BatD family protein [Roseovarius albus]SLN45784.1 hypothetical protein ROA7450_02227 [Roseovarius albus]